MTERFKMEYTACPNCGHPLNGGTDMLDGPNGQKIRPGTLGLCMYCVEVIVYLEEGRMEVVNAEELAVIEREYPDLYKQLITAQKYLKDDKT